MAQASIDVLAQLIGPSWRGVPFPLTRLRNSGSQDHVEHKMPDRDGYHVEAMGRNNLVFAATIPFRNGVMAGVSDQWNGRILYPDVFRAFLGACADHSSGDLIHPELGRITVKCRSFEWEYVPDKRDGVDFEVTWIESLDDGADLNAIIAAESPIAAAIAVAQNLDDSLTELTPPPPELANDTQSFSDMMRSIRAIPDTAALLSKQGGGLLHRVASKLDSLFAALDRLNDTRLWPIQQGAEHLQSSVHDMTRLLGTSNTVIRQITTTIVTTLPQLANRLRNKIDDMMRLNPLLLEEPAIPAGSIVRYYVRIS